MEQSSGQRNYSLGQEVSSGTGGWLRLSENGARADNLALSFNLVTLAVRNSAL